MPDLNIRNVPQELMRFLKSDAAYRGQTLREHCLEKLEVANVGSSVGDGKERGVVGGSGIHAPVGRGRTKKGVARVGVSLPDGEVHAQPRPATKDRGKAKPSDPVEVTVVVTGLDSPCTKPNHKRFKNGDKFYCMTCEEESR